MGKKRVIAKSGQAGGEEAVASLIARKATSKERFSSGRVYILSTYNNTLMTLTDEKGDARFAVSAGRMGFKGARKSTPFAASKAADALASAASAMGVESLELFVKGVGPGRDSALRSLASKAFDITAIHDVTPIPHNGPRPKKPRRV